MVDQYDNYPHSVPKLIKNGRCDLRCGSLWAIIPSMNHTGVNHSAIHRTSPSKYRRETAPCNTCKVSQSMGSGSRWIDMVLHPMASNWITSTLHPEHAQRALHRGPSRSELDSKRGSSRAGCDSSLSNRTSRCGREQSDSFARMADRTPRTPSRSDCLGSRRSTRNQIPGRLAGSVQRSTREDVRSRGAARQTNTELGTFDSQNTRPQASPGRLAQRRTSNAFNQESTKSGREATQRREPNRLSFAE